jgi:hypothetical protein
VTADLRYGVHLSRDGIERHELPETFAKPREAIALARALNARLDNGSSIVNDRARSVASPQ